MVIQAGLTLEEKEKIRLEKNRLSDTNWQEGLSVREGGREREGGRVTFIPLVLLSPGRFTGLWNLISRKSAAVTAVMKTDRSSDCMAKKAFVQ